MNPLDYEPSKVTGAVISDDGVFRYVLWRTWDPELPRVAYCMLNPSTADGTEDDATIRRCVGFARDQGYGAIDVINLFAYRATKPDELIPAAGGNGQNWWDITGTENPAWWAEVLAGSDALVCAWGAWWNNVPVQKRPPRDSPVKLAREFRVPVLCLGLTKGGQPKHPLYIPTTQEFEAFDGL